MKTRSTCPPFRIMALAFCLMLSPLARAEEASTEGYRGIWFTLGQYRGQKYGDKYAGGLGTYTAKHVPIAAYAAEANKTFFTYGGTIHNQRHLLIMAGSYDHNDGTVSRPTLVHDKQGVTDPHDNASICIDDDGHVWIFVSGRGRARPGFKYRSVEPYSIDEFERVTQEEMTYPQPWYLPKTGFVHMFTKYARGRDLYWETSPDGREWSEDHKLVGFGGHYQVTGRLGTRIVSAFNWHPEHRVDRRTNLYFIQTHDHGHTWTNIHGEALTVPLESPDNPALVRDYAGEGMLVYMKDINFDAEGNPVIMYVTSHGHSAGPEGDPRELCVAHWDGSQWQFHSISRTDHNYDMGSLHIEPDGTWRAIAPTIDGPQVYGTGGEMAMWVSRDRGVSWELEQQITSGSLYNHTYARRPMPAHPDFYALWADGNAFEMSPSRLYFTNQAGDQTYVLPETMTQPRMRPEKYLTPTIHSVNVGTGWAKNTVNAPIFRQHALTTHGQTQYIAFYNDAGEVVLGRRPIDREAWELVTTRYKGDVRDAHNAISMAVDGRGVLHLAWDHHGHPLQYARSVAPGSLELTDPQPMTGVNEASVTYPEFYNLASGDLLFLYREGVSGRGQTMLNRYDVATGEWSPVQHPLIDGQGQRNAYTNQIAIDHRGFWHISWVWRESGDVATNHGLCYARSEDQGKTWVKTDGTPYTLPITAWNAEVVQNVPQKNGLINQCSMAVDSRGRPMIATYYRPSGADVPQYHLVWFDGTEWHAQQVTKRRTPFDLSGGGTKRIPMSRPKLAVDDQDRIYMLFRDAERGDRVSVAICDDPTRAVWTRTDLTRDSVGQWEPCYDQQRWQQDNVMHIYVQRVGQGDGETLENLPAQMISVLEWTP
ncbi:BNR-4 repeat-containing protein [Mucisphaera calidilacus]|nr:BNR-4 repeat-containing protein [Mucisphaera calidilacus]